MEGTACDEDEVFCGNLAVFFKDQSEILVLYFIHLLPVYVSMYLSSTYFKCLFSLYLYFLCMVSINEWDWLSGYILANSGLSLPPPWGRPCDAPSLCSPMWHCGCSLFSSFPHFLSLFPYFPLFPIMAILDKLALLLIPVGETVSPTAAVMRSQSFQKWGKHGLYYITPTPSLHWEHLSCSGHLTNP